MTGQNDRQDESLIHQVRDQARHCPLTNRYFQPCSYSMNPLNFFRKLIKRNFWSIFIEATFLKVIRNTAAWGHFGVRFKKLFINSIPAKQEHYFWEVLCYSNDQPSTGCNVHTTKIWNMFASIFLCWPPYLRSDRGPASLTSKSVVPILP